MIWNQLNIEKLNRQFESTSPEELLKWAFETFGAKVTLASSFGAEDAALIHMAAGVSPSFRIFTLDTGRLPEETYQVMDAVRGKYKVTIEAYFPDAARVEELVRKKGFFSFKESVENRKECCGIRKVEPLRRALKGMEAWVTGLRREQAESRSNAAKIELDAAQGGILKINPLADWTEANVWEFVRKNGVPYNKLHDAGYPSIGCAPCTRAVKAGEGVRAGRWWWESPEYKECGLHPDRGDASV